MPKMTDQNTDNWNPINGVDAVGENMRPVPTEQPAVPTSKEFNAHQFTAEDFEKQRDC